MATKPDPLGGLVDVVQRHVAANFGPDVVREMLRLYDRRKLSAVQLVEGLRSMVQIIDSGKARRIKRPWGSNRKAGAR